jgi:glycosyltransferase involved in cell wall biosynthesis
VDRRVNIGIDTHAAEQEASGNCTWVRGLVEALVGILEPRHRLFLYAGDAGHRWYRRFDGDAAVRVRGMGPGGAVARLLFAMPMASLRDGLDVLHVQYVGPPLHHGALVVTVHDVAFETHGETFPALLRARLRWQVPREIRRAALVTTISEASASAIVAAYGTAREHLRVIPGGVSPRFRPVAADPATLSRHGIDAPFLLSVGRLNPRKNLAGLIAAFESLRERRPGRVQLVLVGEDDYGAASLREVVARSSASADIVLAGRLDDEALALLYAAASVFVFPSFFEGFGLPPLEAMASGTPVVSSDGGGLAEVLGDAAIRIDPFSTESIAAGIERVLDDAELASRMTAAGLARAQTFSWEATARAMLAAYGEAVDTGHSGGSSR